MLHRMVVTTPNFTTFNTSETALEAEVFRVYGPNADLAKDVEIECISVSEDSNINIIASNLTIG
jgi:hypothetical protein